MKTEYKKGTLIKLSDGTRFISESSSHTVELCITENRPFQIRSLTYNNYTVVNPKYIVYAEDVYITKVYENKVYYNRIPKVNEYLFLKETE